MAVTRTQPFIPAKVSIARVATTQPSGSRARTAPAPTRRTTPRRSNLAALTALNGPSTGRSTISPHLVDVKHDDGPRSILGQFWDLAKGLPQGLVGFGKDIATDAIVVPHLA